MVVNGRPVSVDSWRSRRATALVKLLSMEPEHRLHREQVMEALWPDLPADAAAANLRKVIHYARRALGSEDAISVEGGLLLLWPNATVEVDLERFHREAGEALSSGDPDACARAASIYGGDLLPADRYEPWVEEARARTHSRYVALLKGAGDWESVLDLDETDEQAHRALMQAHFDAGNRREAIRQFERLRDALREHIGVGPDATTVALYEKILAEGHEPPSPAEYAAALLANGLVAWNRRDLAEAERLAREGRAFALTAGLGHELGEASTLLALIAYARGTWHELFREEFSDSVRRGTELEMAVYDAHLCFQEFYLYGRDGHGVASEFARELLDIARRAGSIGGQALATLLLGEFQLLSGDVDGAAETLERAVLYARDAGCVSAHCIALERLAEAEVEGGKHEGARRLLDMARPIAEASRISSHLIVRLLGVQVRAAAGTFDALRAVRDAEREVAEAPRVCEPCSMNFRIEAARALARAGDLARARRHLVEAERITSLWQGGPWRASVWEVRAELRRAEGEESQARALFLEAAGAFAELGRPVDEARCHAAALAPV